MKVTKKDIGKRCVVEYDDMGRIEAMILFVECHTSEQFVEIYDFATRDLDNVEFDQIVEIGDFIRPR